MSKKKKPQRPDRNVLDLIQMLPAEKIVPADLNKRERLALVEHLTLENYTCAQIGKIIGRDPHTVSVIRRKIREKNALQRDPRLTAEIAGSMFSYAESSAARLRSIQRDPKAKPSDRIAAECASFAVRRDTIRILQSMGYIEMADRPVRSELETDAARRAEAELADIREAAALPPLLGAPLRALANNESSSNPVPPTSSHTPGEQGDPHDIPTDPTNFGANPGLNGHASAATIPPSIPRWAIHPKFRHLVPEAPPPPSPGDVPP